MSLIELAKKQAIRTLQKTPFKISNIIDVFSQSTNGIEISSEGQWLGLCKNGLKGWRITAKECKEKLLNSEKSLIQRKERKIIIDLPLTSQMIEEIKDLLGGEWIESGNRWWQQFN